MKALMFGISRVRAEDLFVLALSQLFMLDLQRTTY